jgi:hypothetical protein
MGGRPFRCRSTGSAVSCCVPLIPYGPRWLAPDLLLRVGSICEIHNAVLSGKHGHEASSQGLLRAAYIAAVTTMFVKQPPRVGCSQWRGI